MRAPSPCIKRNLLFLLPIILAFSSCWTILCLAAQDEINVYCDKEIGEINKKVFGNNFIAYDPAAYEDWAKDYYGYSDYGSGLWDPKNNHYIQETVDLAKLCGMSVIRFPGGCGAHRYDWKKAIGKEREHFLFGIDEFMETCRAIGAEPVFTISYFTGNEHDAADLIEYLNAPDDGRHKWAKVRSKNGHREPYKVKYFEIGNEDWHGDHRQIKSVSPADYAGRYLDYYSAMKAVDPEIKIGVILCAPSWDKQVLEIVRGQLDFGIIHIYPETETKILGINPRDPKEIYNEILNAKLKKAEKNIIDTLRLLEETSGRLVPVAVTEYNCGFTQQEPVPLRHCLGTALLNAEFLRIFMQPRNNILMANYWQYSNSYWGMVKSEQDFVGRDYSEPIHYIKRPNFYVYELYNRHLGDILIDSQHSNSNITVTCSKSKEGDKIYLMIVNKDLQSDSHTVINLTGRAMPAVCDSWTLNGPSVDSTNEQDPDNVKVTYRRILAQGNKFSFDFPAHSLTAIEINLRLPRPKDQDLSKSEVDTEPPSSQH